MSEVKEFLEGVQTPCLVLPSYFGHLLYSPLDLQTSLSNEKQVVLYDVADLLHKDFGDNAIASLCDIPDNLVPIMSFRGSVGPSVNADNKGISLNTKTGRRQVTIENYLKRIAIDKPKAVISLADEVCCSL